MQCVRGNRRRLFLDFLGLFSAGGLAACFDRLAVYEVFFEILMDYFNLPNTDRVRLNSLYTKIDRNIYTKKMHQTILETRPEKYIAHYTCSVARSNRAQELKINKPVITRRIREGASHPYNTRYILYTHNTRSSYIYISTHVKDTFLRLSLYTRLSLRVDVFAQSSTLGKCSTRHCTGIQRETEATICIYDCKYTPLNSLCCMCVSIYTAAQGELHLYSRRNNRTQPHIPRVFSSFLSLCSYSRVYIYMTNGEECHVSRIYTAVEREGGEGRSDLCICRLFPFFLSVCLALYRSPTGFSYIIHLCPTTRCVLLLSSTLALLLLLFQVRVAPNLQKAGTF